MVIKMTPCVFVHQSKKLLKKSGLRHILNMNQASEIRGLF
jgi:hypothetical protein